MDGKVNSIKEDYFDKKSRYLYIIATTKNPKTRRDYEKALKRLENTRRTKNENYSCL